MTPDQLISEVLVTSVSNKRGVTEHFPRLGIRLEKRKITEQDMTNGSAMG